MATDGTTMAAAARSVVDTCLREHVRARLLGGIAFYLQCPVWIEHGPLYRAYEDFDLAVVAEDARRLSTLLDEAGYSPDKSFNAVHGATRLLFHGPGWDVDVFVDVFEECKTLSLRPWLAPDGDGVTLPRDVLLMTKLQVAQLSLKDATDAAGLLLEHPDLTTNAPTLLRTAARDWGWYTLCSDNLAKISDAVAGLLGAEEREQLATLIAALQHQLDAVPKSMAWRARAKLGRTIPWYVIPEDK
jgi:hypothetical protein